MDMAGTIVAGKELGVFNQRTEKVEGRRKVLTKPFSGALSSST
jgi:hypothetical protein